MIGMNDLKPGVFFIYEGAPYVVLEAHHLKMQQRRPVQQTRMRNLLNGKIIERNFQQSDSLEEADIEKKKVKFLYNHREEYWFTEENNSSARFKLAKEILGDAVAFLKANTEVEAMLFNGETINIELPVKMDFKVVEAPPSIKGNTAQGGVKQVKLETGAIVNVPLFVETGDEIRINTQTGEYVERISKTQN
ncbi:MAG: elongation factor P [Parcubacteria group bacterium Licking1014_17]|nr:MAG: elongation factor P [Parcubacteria group bacterium Licking1014_17]